MCYALFVGVRGHPGDPAAVFIARGYTVEVSSNPTCAQLEIPEVLAVSDGHCACWLYIPTQRYAGEDTQLMRSRYRRKGWPDGKIERAVKARCVADEKRAARRGNRNQFLAMIEELVTSGAQVSLLAHFFDGPFDEAFQVHTHRKLLLTEFLFNGGTFQEDELTVIGG